MKRLAEPLKTLALIILTVIMLFLFMRTWLYDNAAFADILPDALRWLAPSNAAEAPNVRPSRAEAYGSAVTPIAAAVMWPDGLYGAVTSQLPAGDPTVASLYTRVSPIMAEVLGLASELHPIRRAEWEAALTDNETYLYFEFSNEQPILLFALSQGVEYGDESIWFDRIAVVDVGENGYAVLFAREDDSYYHADINLANSLVSNIATLLEGYAPNGYAFSFDPEMLLPPEGVTFAAHNVTAGAAATGDAVFSSFLEAFLMNPLTNYRYSNSAGTQFAVEDTKSLTLTAAGELTFINTDAVPTADITLQAAIELCRKLVADATRPLIGDASLSLRSAEKTDGGTRVTFGYLVGGLTLYADGADAAFVFELKGNAIESAKFILRRYTFDGSSSVLIPPATAAAIGARRLCYYDDGGNVTVQWTAG